MTFSVRKVATAEQATWLGVNVGDTVFVAPINELVPLIKECEAPAPTPNVSLAFDKTNLSVNEKKILGVLKSMGNSGYGRGEVLDRAKMTPSEWSTAIAALKSSGLVKQTGDRRSAKYFVAGEPSAEVSEAPKQPETSPELAAALERAKRVLAGEDLSKEPAPMPVVSTETEVAEPLAASEIDETIEEIPGPEANDPTDQTEDTVSAALKGLGATDANW